MIGQPAENDVFLVMIGLRIRPGLLFERPIVSIVARSRPRLFGIIRGHGSVVVIVAVRPVLIRFLGFVAVVYHCYDDGLVIGRIAVEYLVNDAGYLLFVVAVWIVAVGLQRYRIRA